MHRTLTVLILPLVLFMQPAAAYAVAGGPTLSLQLSAATAAVNGQFTATIQLNTKTYQVSAVELHLTYPADKLQALSITKGAFLANQLVAGAVGSGTASITLGSGTTPVQGTGAIATITFKALAAGTAAIGFAGTTAVAAIGSTGNVVDTMTPASVTISGTAVPTATPVRTPTPSAAAGVGQAGQVSTGPLESTMLALLTGAIITLLYVGYVGSDSFRRHEVEDIAKEERDHPSDLNR
jgi:hypothetical protein